MNKVVNVVNWKSNSPIAAADTPRTSLHAMYCSRTATPAPASSFPHTPPTPTPSKIRALALLPIPLKELSLLLAVALGADVALLLQRPGRRIAAVANGAVAQGPFAILNLQVHNPTHDPARTKSGAHGPAPPAPSSP